MMLRVLVAGALVGLPLLVSGATAQTPATPPDFSRVSGCAGQSGERALGAPGLASPFMPTPNVGAPQAAPPTIGAEATPSGPPPAAAPIPVETPAPPKPKKVAPPPPPRETALSDDPAADASA